MRCKAITLEGKQCHAESAHEEFIPTLGMTIAVCGTHFNILYKTEVHGTLDDLEKLLKRWHH